MRFSKKIIPRQFFNVILWIANEYVIWHFREINSRKINFSCKWNGFLREINSENKNLCTITHKNITELIQKQLWFGNSSTKITKSNSQNNSVRDSVFLCSHYLPRPRNSRNKSVGNHRARITKNNSKIMKFGSVILLCVMVCNLFWLERKLHWALSSSKSTGISSRAHIRPPNQALLRFFPWSSVDWVRLTDTIEFHSVARKGKNAQTGET